MTIECAVWSWLCLYVVKGRLFESYNGKIYVFFLVSHLLRPLTVNRVLWPANRPDWIYLGTQWNSTSFTQFWLESKGMKKAQAYFSNPKANHIFYFLWFLIKKLTRLILYFFDLASMKPISIWEIIFPTRNLKLYNKQWVMGKTRTIERFFLVILFPSNDAVHMNFFQRRKERLRLVILLPSNPIGLQQIESWIYSNLVHCIWLVP